MIKETFLALVRNTLWYTASGIFGQGLAIVQMLVVRSLLLPEVLGIWNYAGVVQGFCKTLNWGVETAAQWELAKGKGCSVGSDLRVIEQTVLVSNLLYYLAMGIGILIFGYWTGRLGNWFGGIAIIGAAVLFVLRSVAELIIILLKSSHRFVLLSKATSIGRLISVGAILIGVVSWGIEGMFLGAIIGAVFELLLLWNVAGLTHRNRSAVLDLAIFQQLLGIGLRIRLMDYPASLIRIGDVVLVTALFDPTALAIYVTAKNILDASNKTLAFLRTAFIFRLFSKYGAGDLGRNLGSNLRNSLIVEGMLIIPCSVICLYTASHLLVANILENYVECLPILSILLMSLFFTSGFHQLKSMFLIERRYRSLAVINYSVLAAGFVLLLAIRRQGGMTLEGCALCFLQAVGLYWVLILANNGVHIGAFHVVRILVMYGFSFAMTFWTLDLLKGVLRGESGPELHGQEFYGLVWILGVVLVLGLGLNNVRGIMIGRNTAKV